MPHFNCLIQDAGVARSRSVELERQLVEHHGVEYPGEQATVSWRSVPDGFMFTEGEQSTSSIIVCTIDHPTTLAGRERYMRRVCDIWTDVTGCTDHEVVVVISEAPPTE